MGQVHEYEEVVEPKPATIEELRAEVERLKAKIDEYEAKVNAAQDEIADLFVRVQALME